MATISIAAETLDTLTQIIAHHEMRWTALHNTLAEQAGHYESMAVKFPDSDCASVASQIRRDLASMYQLEDAFPMARKTEGRA